VRVKRLKGKQQHFRVANGGLTETVGKVLLKIRFLTKTGSSRVYRVPMFVVEGLAQPILLGCDFMQRTRAVMSFDRQELILQGDQVPLTIKMEKTEWKGTEPIPLFLATTVKLRQETRQWCVLTTGDDVPLKEWEITGLITSCDSGLSLQVGRGIAILKNGEVAVSLANLTRKRVATGRGTQVALFTPMAEDEIVLTKVNGTIENSEGKEQKGGDEKTSKPVDEREQPFKVFGKDEEKRAFLAKIGKSEITPHYLFPEAEFSDDEGDGGFTFALSGIEA